MIARRLIGALVVLLVLSGVTSAHASCGTICRGTVGEVQVEPALDCATVEASLNDCGCRVLVTVVNRCPGKLSVAGADLICESEASCEVEPGGLHGLRVRVDRAGAQEWSLTLKDGETGEHALSFAGDITEYDDDPDGCSLANASTKHAGKGSFVALAAIGLLARARARRRAH